MFMCAAVAIVGNHSNTGMGQANGGPWGSGAHTQPMGVAFNGRLCYEKRGTVFVFIYLFGH